MPTATSSDRAPEPAIHAIGTGLFAHMPQPGRASLTRAERRMTTALMSDPELRAALFRFVDVRPACATPQDVTRHLVELLGDASGSTTARRASSALARPMLTRPTASVAGAGVRQLARRFIVGADTNAALPAIARLWRAGVGSTVDLLGEATVTEAEADHYARRCEEALHSLARAAVGWQSTPILDADSIGQTPRASLSIKISALTPELRAIDPVRGAAGAEARVRRLLRLARDLNAHLHIDMESFDSRDATTLLVRTLLSEEEFRAGPSAGVVLQAYLIDSEEQLDDMLDWTRDQPRSTPLTVRLVKGAYWDHEVVVAAQHGWTAPVFTDRRACDRNYEQLTRRLLDARPLVRTAIASHNLRSVAHAAAYAESRGLDVRDVEFQVLRGLGDDLQTALVAGGRRVRCYAPVGDLVAGMAYLVRRLLENTANDSFLASHASGIDPNTLLEAP